MPLRSTQVGTTATNMGWAPGGSSACSRSHSADRPHRIRHSGQRIHSDWEGASSILGDAIGQTEQSLTGWTLRGSQRGSRCRSRAQGSGCTTAVRMHSSASRWPRHTGLIPTRNLSIAATTGSALVQLYKSGGDAWRRRPAFAGPSLCRPRPGTNGLCLRMSCRPATDGLSVVMNGQGGGNVPITGPVAVGLHSLYRRSPGVSSQSMEHRGGATTSQFCGEVIAGAGGGVRTFFRETHDRQVAAGGSGRVLVCLQGGVNLGDWWTGAADYTVLISKLRDALDALRGAWKAEGLPPDDLAFLIMVSHPTAPTDEPLAGLREAVRVAMVDVPDVTVVNLGLIAPCRRERASRCLRQPIARRPQRRWHREGIGSHDSPRCLGDGRSHR